MSATTARNVGHCGKEQTSGDSDGDELVSRLMARIAGLETKLYASDDAAMHVRQPAIKLTNRDQTNEELIPRLIARIAELESTLYEKDLAASAEAPPQPPPRPSRDHDKIKSWLYAATGATAADPAPNDPQAAAASPAAAGTATATTTVAAAAPGGGKLGSRLTSKAESWFSHHTSKPDSWLSQSTKSDWYTSISTYLRKSGASGEHKEGDNHSGSGKLLGGSGGGGSDKGSSAGDLIPAGRETPPDGAIDTAVEAEVAKFAKSVKAQLPQTYYRYVFDPADVQAELEVTHQVRKVAAEALAEANQKLAAAEEGQRQLREQLNAAIAMAQEVDRLKEENAALLARREALEADTLATKTELDSWRQQSAAVQAELEGARKEAAIWSNSRSSEQEKLKQENSLLRNQLQTRVAELSAVRTKLSVMENERSMFQRDWDMERQMIRKQREDALAQLAGLQDVQQRMQQALATADQATKASADWQDKFVRERAIRRKLHDQLQVLRGNIRVMCRARPAQPGLPSVIGYPLDGLLSVCSPDKRYQEFEFDHVFGPDATQESIFQEISPLVRSCADGFNVCIFAYGQTGSGKTFTMEGTQQAPGVNVRALQELFRIGAEESASTGQRWEFSVAMMEIYNESVLDLLRAGDAVARPVEVSGLGAGEMPPGMDRVQGLIWRHVSTTEEVQALLREGSRNRATASTAMNAHSSRSHALLSVKILFTPPEGKPFTSLLHLVDLAGSERVDKSGVTGDQLREAQAINKSLSALGDVISSLQRKNAHIPFRNSKLTQVLQDSLCGNSKVLLVCNLSPEPGSVSETVSSLNFAQRAAQVELGQARRTTTEKAGNDRATSPVPPGLGSPSSRSNAPPGKDSPLRKSTTSMGPQLHGPVYYSRPGA